MRSLIFVLFLLIATGAKAQLPDGRKVSLGTTVGNDTIPMVNLPVVDIYAAIDPAHAENLKRYLKLRRDVLRAYPYAKLASQQLKLINDSTRKIKSERARKKFIKEKEKDLKARFEKDLKNLTYTQGRILIKLIDRETGNTSYELVKDLRGSFQAFFWQSFARLFGTNLKSEYDAAGEDRLIEGIVQAIERGELQVIKK
ncbi:MAG: DUF4294 domain-containing protein [Bacteroidetes bacterium]|nr:DUF4294 domain-containing protein [Bacteroidota bacterium]